MKSMEAWVKGITILISMERKPEKNSFGLFIYIKQMNEPKIAEQTKNLYYFWDFYSLILTKPECIYVLKCIKFAQKNWA